MGFMVSFMVIFHGHDYKLGLMLRHGLGRVKALSMMIGQFLPITLILQRNERNNETFIFDGRGDKCCKFYGLVCR